MTRDSEFENKKVLRKSKSQLVLPLVVDKELGPPSRRPSPAPPQPETRSPAATPKKLRKRQSLPQLQLPPPPSDSPTPARRPRDGSLGPHTLDPEHRERPKTSSLLPPSPDQRRSISTPLTGRSASTNLSVSDHEGKQQKRRSWLPGPRSKPSKSSQDLEPMPPRAWILAGGNQIDYSLHVLLEGERIPELWDESPEANLFVYLHPKSSGRDPQIKCRSVVVQCSQPLLDTIYDNTANSATENAGSRHASLDDRPGLTVEGATRPLAIQGPESPLDTPQVRPDNPSGFDESGGEFSSHSYADAPRDLHLYYPVELSSGGPQWAAQDVQKLVDARNLFAFFNGQPLISTPTAPSVFNIFTAIGDALKRFEFYSQDGTGYGEEADSSFAFYLAEMRLADVRLSREKTIEGLLLGERMRCSPLYNESFAHAVGKFESIKGLNLSIYRELSPTTQLQLQTSSRDLARTQDAINIRLTDFEFPSMFSGIGSSTSMDEAKIVRFKMWKIHFLAMRKHVITFYRDKYGQWPPKANSKKNSFNVGGLNRLVLKLLYADLCALYDLLVDRTAFTTRGVFESEDRDGGLSVTPQAAALRKLLAEYDRASPPVQPPIPFDTPLVATMAALDPRYNTLSPKDQHKLANRRLKPHELGLLQERTHNKDVNLKTPFVQAFREFELREGKGKSAAEFQEQRFGYWIFLYAVIQCLPMLVTDAPNLKYTEGVEHFLCQMPVNTKPWVEDGGHVTKAWYGVAGGAGMVNLPSHVVEFSVEAVYSRSHCWKLAESLVGADASPAVDDDPYAYFGMEDGHMSPLQPPPGFGDDDPRPVSRGRNRSSSSGQLAPMHSLRGSEQSLNRRSVVLGLERLPAAFDMDESDWPGSRPMSRASFGGRTASPMRARGAASRGGESPLAGGGSTFDDILGKMDGGAKEEEKGKKKKAEEKKKGKKKGFF